MAWFQIKWLILYIFTSIIYCVSDYVKYFYNLFIKSTIFSTHSIFCENHYEGRTHDSYPRRHSSVRFQSSFPKQTHSYHSTPHPIIHAAASFIGSGIGFITIGRNICEITKWHCANSCPTRRTFFESAWQPDDCVVWFSKILLFFTCSSIIDWL